MENRWTVCIEAQRVFPYWEFSLPNEYTREEWDKIIYQVYSFAYQEDLYRIVRKGATAEQNLVLDINDVDSQYLRVSRSGRRDQVTDNGLKISDYEEQLNISYYSEGQVVTKWIKDFVFFTRDLNPEKYTEIPKVEDDEGSLPMNIELPWASQDPCRIALNSDIWFPHVVGWMDEDQPTYDNSELAALHTPRLNRFIQRTKKFIQNLGGEWRPLNISQYIPDECRITEDGIELEVPESKPRNQWCILEDQCRSLYWTASFEEKKPDFEDPREVWPLIRTILEVGQQEKIFRTFVDESDLQNLIHDVDTGNLPVPSLHDIQNKQLVKTYQHDMKVNIDDLPKYLHRIVGDTCISYYNPHGEIAETYLSDNPGEFLRHLQYGRFGDESEWMYTPLCNYAPDCQHIIKFEDRFSKYKKRFENHFLSSDTPTEIETAQQNVYTFKTFYEYSLQVTLNSDIWFPRVPGLLEKKSWITKNYLNHSLYCPIVEYRKLDVQVFKLRLDD
jgi:hypothetical protein